MKSRIRKELLTRFKGAFERLFAGFEQLKLPRGTPPIWACTIAPNLTLFVLLQPFEQYDRFAVEVAWNDNPEFPWDGIGRLRVESSVGRERLSWLWTTGSKEFLWDVAPDTTRAIEDAVEARRNGKSPIYRPEPPVDEIVPRVAPLVDDAIQKLVEFGVPLFRR